MEQILKILSFILESFIHIWPYLLITIPLAVVVQLTGIAKFINKALSKKPLVSILLATMVGAFSPFCSCGVIPVITSLLIGGVPLAPVMSFWIASPSMDPEIFFLSTAAIGWNLAVWRLAATFFISLSAGFITHLALSTGLLGKEILRDNNSSPKLWASVKQFLYKAVLYFKDFIFPAKVKNEVTYRLILSGSNSKESAIYCCGVGELPKFMPEVGKTVVHDGCGCESPCQAVQPSLQKRIITETWKAVLMVCKFMTLAFLVNALISFYVPQDFVADILGDNGSVSVIVASLVGIPVYTSNITALPLVSGLLSLGMNKGAALAFLISGPMTTLPAMSAVWGIVRIRVFLLYISFALVGSVFFGLLFNLLNHT